MPEPLSAAIVGGSGYVGGELLRLLLAHPHVTVLQITSESQTGRPVHTVHPNLRSVTDLKFSQEGSLDAVDILFLALPHGSAAGRMDHFDGLAQRIIDCSADFRLRDAGVYAQWYGHAHPDPDRLPRFVYGLPERHRSELTGATHASGVGCNASATILALGPLADEGLLERVVADIKVGSSEAGSRPSESSHHPERSGVIRSFMPTGHRHQAEVVQTLGTGFDLSFSVTSVGLVRGVLVTAHCFLRAAVTEKDLWALYRNHYGSEPFIRLVNQRRGIHRYPEPRLTTGSNFCDVGFVVDQGSRHRRVVVLAALDNLVKGAAGSAVQSMNLMIGCDEVAGLGFPGLHPL
ncbi:MAG: N-acetyl-gamma-glutamyl-phosphate reductase [Gemmatimonadota bacterium]|nr:MAG: N-acetyl-gamma-glutamyl-phosphate reductase [Gemmatimonadota bacterium]